MILTYSKNGGHIFFVTSYEERIEQPDSALYKLSMRTLYSSTFVEVAHFSAQAFCIFLVCYSWLRLATRSLFNNIVP